MKQLIFSILLMLTSQASFAITSAQQQEALLQLEVARAEIATVRSLMPEILKKTIGKNLSNADERMAYAQKILAISPVGSIYFCTVQSSFDGQFSGKGATQLEAADSAMQACKLGSRSNGMFCKERTIKCQKEQ